MAVDDLIQGAQTRMDKSVEHARTEFNTVRTGRASAALLDRIQIDYYGTQTPLKQLATINAPEARLLTVQPYDASSIKAIEKAIMESDVGLTPNNDGSIIRLQIPDMTEERRREMVKVARHLAEEGRIAIRHARTHARDTIKKLDKVPEDDKKHAEKDLQKLHDDYIARIDQLTKAKEAEIMEV